MNFRSPAFLRYASLSVCLIVLASIWLLGDASVWVKVLASAGTAFLTWLANIWTEAYKHRASVMDKHFQFLTDCINEVDGCLWELKKLAKDVNGGLAFRWEGQSLEEWNTNAMEAWNRITESIEELRKALWIRRSFLHDYDEIDKQIADLSFALKGVLQAHMGWQNKTAGMDFERYGEKSDKVATLLPALDQRLRSERKKIYEDSLAL